MSLSVSLPPRLGTLNKAAAAVASIRAEALRRQRVELEEDFFSFVETFWSCVEPSIQFRTNWHIETICDHLEAVEQGIIKNLVINVPPGTSKSTLTSVMFPAWVWTKQPGARFFGASYSEPLAIRDLLLCRAIITSPKYQALWPSITVKRGQDQKTKFALETAGWRMATTVGGRGTGEHPTFKIVDDPHNVKQSESDVQRQDALDWFDGTLSSRGLGFANAATIVIMQRLHQKDLTGHIEKLSTYKSEWDHIVIPMRYEPGRKLPQTRLGYKDPRTQAGQLLWPEVFTESKVRSLETLLGTYRTAGQLQQRPSPDGGGILQVDFVRLWSAKQRLPDLFYVVQSYDTAFTKDTANDPTACTVWGVGEHETGPFKGKRFAILLDAWTEHMSYPDLRDKAIEDWDATYGGSMQNNGVRDPLHPPRRADALLIEEKGSGISLIQDLRQANLPVRGYNPGRADKTARAHVVAPLIEADLVYVLESKREPGKPISWARPLLEQCEQFPNGEHDDLVDTLTQALIHLRDAEFLVLEAAADLPPDTRDYYGESQARRNPYR